jgi:hypothetical protein
VLVVGNFDGRQRWEIPMRHVGGLWEARVWLPPGRYSYGFQMGALFVPAGCAVVPGNFAGWSCKAMTALALSFTCPQHWRKWN